MPPASRALSSLARFSADEPRARFPLSRLRGRGPEHSHGGGGLLASPRSALSRPILTAFGSSTLSRTRERGKGACGSRRARLNRFFEICELARQRAKEVR